jgi:hypothetical protein
MRSSSHQKRSGEEHELTCEAACDLLETALSGSFRRDVVDGALSTGSTRKAVRALRSGMRSHSFKTASHQIALGEFVRKFDRLTREEGLEVLHTWDHGRHIFCKEITPVLILDRHTDLETASRSERVSLAILLDFYFLHLLILCAVRAWDQNDPDAVLDRVTGLLRVLQGPDGSGHQFVDDAETLLMLALAQFHPDDHVYRRFIEKIWTMNRAHLTNFARISTAVLGAHLRWGFGVMYRRDVTRMREDNVGDYPWLLFALETLMQEYARLHDEGVQGAEREEVVEGLLNGLTCDPWAFVGKAPDALEDLPELYNSFCELLGQYGEDFVEECKRHRPSAEGFSPLAFHFNFPHNVLTAILMIALAEGSARSLPMNAVLLGSHDGTRTEGSPDDFAKTLTAFAGSSPGKLDSHGARLIIYDRHAGYGYCNMVTTTIGKYLAEMTEGSPP